MIVLGLDLSLVSSGIAVVDTKKPADRLLFREGTRALPRVPTPGRSPKARTKDRGLVPVWDRAKRIADLADRILLDVNHLPLDLAVVEAPSFGSPTSGAAHERSGLFWTVVGSLRSVGVPVAEVAPKSRALYATGDGAADKKSVVDATVARYGLGTRDDNIVDAFVLAAMGCHAYFRPLDRHTTEVQAAALRGVIWPALPTLTKGIE